MLLELKFFWGARRLVRVITPRRNTEQKPQLTLKYLLIPIHFRRYPDRAVAGGVLERTWHIVHIKCSNDRRLPSVA